MAMTRALATLGLAITIAAAGAGCGARALDPTAPAGEPQPTESPIACDDLPAAIRARWIAFDSDRDGHRQLYKVHPDGTGLTRILTDASNDMEPSFSPDGKRIAFTSDRAGVTQIFVLDIASGRVDQLTHNRDSGSNAPSFSRDGRRVAFNLTTSAYVTNVDGTGGRLVAPEPGAYGGPSSSPHFSADDAALVFYKEDDVGVGIEAIMMDGTGRRPIVQSRTVVMGDPAVSPSGDEIAYEAPCDLDKMDFGFSIWITPFSKTSEACTGSRLTPLESKDVLSGHATWGTPNLLAYSTSDRSNGVSIAIISRQAGSAPCVIVGDGSANLNPVWSN